MPSLLSESRCFAIASYPEEENTGGNWQRTASTLAILTTVTAVARCKILALPTDRPDNGASDSSERTTSGMFIWTSHFVVGPA